MINPNAHSGARKGCRAASVGDRREPGILKINLNRTSSEIPLTHDLHLVSRFKFSVKINFIGSEPTMHCL